MSSNKQYISQFLPDFKSAPMRGWDKFTTVLLWALPTTWLWVGFKNLVNKILGAFLGRLILLKPPQVHGQRGAIVPRMPAHMSLDKIAQTAIEQKEFSSGVAGKQAWPYPYTAEELKESMSVSHGVLKTADGAFVEHSILGPKALLNPDGTVQKTHTVDADEKDTQVVCFFSGRTRMGLHHLPNHLLRAKDTNMLWASFTHRGLHALPLDKDWQANAKNMAYYRKHFNLRARNDENEYLVSDDDVLKHVQASYDERLQYYLDLLKIPKKADGGYGISPRQLYRLVQKLNHKPLEKSQDLVSDGMAFVAQYLRQGILPKNITLYCRSMGGAGVVVAAHYKKIFRRFENPRWHQHHPELMTYARWLFGLDAKKEGGEEGYKHSDKDVIAHVDACRRAGFEFNVWSETNFSTLSRAITGRVRKEFDEAGWPRLGKLVFWLLWPLVKLTALIARWELNVVDAYCALDKRLKQHVALESPPSLEDPKKLAYVSDTMIQFSGASLHQRLVEKQAKHGVDRQIRFARQALAALEKRFKRLSVDCQKELIYPNTKDGRKAELQVLADIATQIENQKRAIQKLEEIRAEEMGSRLYFLPRTVAEHEHCKTCRPARRRNDAYTHAAFAEDDFAQNGCGETRLFDKFRNFVMDECPQSRDELETGYYDSGEFEGPMPAVPTKRS